MNTNDAPIAGLGDAPGHGPTAADSLLAQLALLPDGLALTAVGQKKAAYLPHWQKQGLSRDQLVAEINAGRAIAIGLICGPLSGGVLIVDHDGASAGPLLQELMGGKSLPPTWTWTSGRDGRWAAAYRVPERYWPRMAGIWEKRTGIASPDDGKAEGLELRWDGHYSVVVGAHPQTTGYSWFLDRSPADLPMAEAPLALILPLIEAALLKKQRKPDPLPLLEQTTPAPSGLRLPLLEFVSLDTKEFVTTGGTPGQWNEDQLRHSQDLVGTETWIQEQGHQAEPSAREAFQQHIDAARQKDRGFSSSRAWARFDGAQKFNPLPSTPVAKLADRLAHHVNQAAGSGGRRRKGAASVVRQEPVKAGGESSIARSTTAGSTTTSKVVPLQEARQRLAEAINDGISNVDVATVVAEVSDATGISGATIQRIADELRREHHRVVEVQQEAAAIAAEVDRQELGQVLTTSYLLPAQIATAVEAVTRYLPGDGPSRTMPFLAAIAGLVKLGTRVEALASCGFVVPVLLFGCMVGHSGQKKSPTDRRLVSEPLAALMDEVAEANRREHDAWLALCENLKRGLVRPPEPVGKRVKIGDFTGEGLAAQLQVQEAAGLGLLIHRDELSALFGSLNAYRGGKGADEQQLLELYDGSGLTSLRVGGHRSYSRSQVSIWGGTQHEVLKALVANGDDSGLWARFLFVPLPRQIVPLPLTSTEQEKAEVQTAAALLAQVASTVFRMAPRTYRLCRDAQETFVRFEENRQRLAAAASIGAAGAIYGKSAGKVLRVAGLLHLLRLAIGEASADEAIGPDLIERATALVDHLDQWALSLHEGVAAGGMGSLLRLVHRIAEAAMQPVGWREVQNRLSKAQRKEVDSAAVSAAMQALADNGYGEVKPGRRGGLSYRALRPLPSAS
jgi:hypothetical protein